MKMNMRIGARILAGYGLALIVAGTVGIIAWQATEDLIASADLVTYTHTVKETLAATLSSLKDAEAGLRGFLLTGEESYLDPYNEAIGIVESDVRKLRELTADNRGQQTRLAVLQPL